VQADKKYLPFKITDQGGKPYIEVTIEGGDTKQFAPEEISAMVSNFY